MFFQLIMLCIASYIIFSSYGFRWIRFKNTVLKKPSNTEIHKDINKFKLSVTKDKLIVTVDLIPKDINNLSEMKLLVDKMPLLLKRKFEVHFDNQFDEDNYIYTFTAIRPESKVWRWTRSVYANAIKRHRK